MAVSSWRSIAVKDWPVVMVEKAWGWGRELWSRQVRKVG